MVRNVVSVKGTMTIEDVVKLMNEQGIGSLVVMEREKLAGIVTERDMLTRVLLTSNDPKTTKVSKVISKPLIVETTQMKLEEKVRLMIEHKIKKLPVTQDGELVGLMTLLMSFIFNRNYFESTEFLVARFQPKSVEVTCKRAQKTQ